MNRYINLIFFLFIYYSSFSQMIIKGKVIDSSTQEPLPFANIMINKNPLLGEISDENGLFQYTSKTKITSVSCTYMGYETSEVIVNNNNYKTLILNMIPSSNNLNEVVLVSRKNPAHIIIEKAQEHRVGNNPMNLNSFTYKSHNKIIYDLETNPENPKVNVKLVDKFKDRHFLMMESISERKYLQPNLSNETILATKVSGFKNPSFASISYDVVPFSVYEDYIEMFDIKYLNPISEGSINKYYFTMEDTLIQQKDSIFVISFRPKSQKNIEGLNGTLHIHTNKYAIQKIEATPAQIGTYDYKFSQEYSFIDGYWFPINNTFDVKMVDYARDKLKFRVQGRSFMENVVINPHFTTKDFVVESLIIDNEAGSRDSVYWINNRIEALNIEEKDTYKTMDSIGKKYKFNQLLKLSEGLSLSKYEIGKIDLDLKKSAVINDFEGYRLGLGAYTNSKFSEYFSLGGFFGWGSKDQKWKYGGNLKVFPTKNTEFLFGLHYHKSLVETGKYYTQNNFGMLSFRGVYSSQFDDFEEFKLSADFRTLRWITANINVSTASIQTIYPSTDNILKFHNTAIQINYRFAYAERIRSSFNQKVSLGTPYPIFNFSYTRGLKNVMSGNFDYNFFKAGVEQNINTKNFGKTHYKIESGIVNSKLPYSMLYTGEGGATQNFNLLSVDTFQTMKMYEFLSDRYVNLFFSHNFGGLLLKWGKFQPDMILHHNASWGDLQANMQYLSMGYKTKDKVFIESGLQFDNLFRINYLDIFKFGFGVGGFYRYGAYRNPSEIDNFAIKFNITYTTK